MILAESELEIGAGRATGIIVLDDTPDAEFAPGTPLAEVLPIATGRARARDHAQPARLPRRLRGRARAARGDRRAARAARRGARTPARPARSAGVEVSVECPDLCPRFTARVFEDVTIGPSPPWLKARLAAAGQRPINNVVDITNYAMLLTGQPLHAFDLDRVAGARLTVRRAARRRAASRRSTARRARSTREMVVIEDADGPTSIAGLMGGARSEVAPRHHARAARGRELERAEHPPHLVGARAAQRGLEPLREGARAGAVHARAGGRERA